MALLANKILLGLAVPGLPALATLLGIFLLMTGFGLLLASGLLLLIRHILLAIRTYFSAPQRKLRRVLFAANHQDAIRQRFHFQKLKLKLIYEAKRQRLAQANEHKHLKALSKSISHDLQTLKTKLPKHLYRQLQQDNRTFLKQKNRQALLELQQKIAGLICT